MLYVICHMPCHICYMLLYVTCNILLCVVVCCILCVVCNMLYVICCVLNVIHHVSHVTCHMLCMLYDAKGCYRMFSTSLPTNYMFSMSSLKSVPGPMHTCWGCIAWWSCETPIGGSSYCRSGRERKWQRSGRSERKGNSGWGILCKKNLYSIKKSKQTKQKW